MPGPSHHNGGDCGRKVDQSLVSRLGDVKQQCQRRQLMYRTNIDGHLFMERERIG